MQNIRDLRDLGEFGQAVESYSKDREKLVELKQLLEQQLLEIKGQLVGLYAANGPQVEPEDAKELEGRIHRAETAKSYVVRKMVRVDSVLARLSREGGWLLFTNSDWKWGWVVTKTPISQWLCAEIELYGDQAREISFSVPITQDQWEKLPTSVTKYEP